jgi:Icc-related predicted phosphoesterase
LKILALSDIHSDLERVRKLSKRMGELKPDIILIGGDIATIGEPSEMQGRIAKDVLDTLYTGKRILAITGNHDSESVIKELETKGAELHNKTVNIDGVGFIGFRGPNTESLGGLYVINYDPVGEKIKDLRECDKKILLSHAPPHGTDLDKTIMGAHLGSEFVKDLIYDEQPDLVICGHIHEGRGVEKLGKTTIVNTGALCEGYAALIDMSKDSPDVEFLFIE